MATVQVASKNRWPFDPRNIPGCALWLDAADANVLFQDTAGTTPAISNGTGVALWKDKSSNANNLLQSNIVNRPAVTTTNGRNSQPAVQFTSANSHFMNLCATKLPAGANPATMFFVARPTIANTTAGIFIMGNSSGQNYSVYTLGAGAALRASAGTAGSVISDSTSNFSNYIMGCIAFGPTFNGYRNSTVFDTSTGLSITLTTGTEFGFLGSLSNASYFSGQIAEIICYSNVLSEPQRQIVEGYLSWKWALNADLATCNVYFTRAPSSRYINPLDISGCRLWLDGADTTTLFSNTSGTNVSVSGDRIALWRDKSGAFNHASQATVSNRPTAISNAQNGQWVVNFAGGGTPSYFSLSATMLPTGSNPVSYFFVTYTGSTATGVFVSIGSNTLGRANQIYYSGATAVLNADINGTGVIADTNSNLSNYVTGGVSFSATTINAWRNGTAFTGAPPAITLNTLTTFAYLGTQSAGANNNFNGRMAELLAYDRVLSSNERRAIEGYLGWKWNLAPSLTAHPFQTLTPATPAFNPRNVSGCQLWLDGADPANMTFSNTSNILTWKDKSGFGRDASSVGVGRAIYTANNTMNGYTAPFFSNAQYYTPAFTWSPTGDITLFTLIRQTGTVTQNTDWIVAPNYQDFDMYLAGSGGCNVNVVTGGVAAVNNYNTGFNASSYTIPFVACITVTAAPTSVRTGIMNGATYPSSNTGANTLNTSLALRVSANPTACIGYVCELVLYNTVLSTADRQRVEGYLTQKWGMLANLSAGHPYQAAVV